MYEMADTLNKKAISQSKDISDIFIMQTFYEHEFLQVRCLTLCIFSFSTVTQVAVGRTW